MTTTRRILSRESMLARMEETNGTRRTRTPKVEINRSAKGATKGARRAAAGADDKKTVDQVMYFEPVGPDHPEVLSGSRDPDDMLVALLKEEINSVGLTRRDLYAFVGSGDGMLFENENQAYNLEYGLRKRATISLDCANRWLAIVGKQLNIAFVPAE
jgi:hypothetical protein